MNTEGIESVEVPLVPPPPMVRRMYVAMGRAVIIDHAEDWSVWDYWSNYHRTSVGISNVSAAGLHELP